MADKQMVRIELIARDGLSPHVAWVEIPLFHGEAPAAVLWGDRVVNRRPILALTQFWCSPRYAGTPISRA
jgi:hypothetical protein